MAEDIGALWKTTIPSLSDIADIQEALRLYHYGAPSGTGTNEYDVNNTSSTALKANSIAGALQSLDNRIRGFQAGITPAAYPSKGSILTVQNSTGTLYAVVRDSSNQDGHVLTLEATSDGGFVWKSPAVTLSNTVTLSNKTLESPSINSSGAVFKGSGSFATTLVVGTLTANRVITLPDATTTLVGTNTQQTLTNKTIDLESSNNTITGTLAVANGGTNAIDEVNARSNLKIFNIGGGSSFGGKIYVANPADTSSSGAGVNGVNLQGAQAGDLWFW